MKQKFELLPHTTDAFLSVNGRTLKEIFENAALGMFEVMTDTRLVRPSSTENVEVGGESEHELLYNWLETLLVRFETNQMVYANFKVKRIKRANGKLQLAATVSGEAFDRGRHPAKVEVKAVTYHQMSIEKVKDGFHAQFILDL
jgi:SHS2 domain-containing protein